MTVTLDQLRETVGADASKNARLQRSLDFAQSEVDTYLADNLTAEELAELPEAVVDRAVLAAAVDDWNLAMAPNGVVNQQYDLGDGDIASTPVRIGRDPLRTARPILAQHVLPAIG